MQTLYAQNDKENGVDFYNSVFPGEEKMCLICMYTIMHGLLDFPCDAAFAARTRIGLRGHTLKIHQQRCKTRRRQHASQRLSSPVLKPAARGYCDCYIRGDTQISTGRKMAVSLPRSSPQTRPPILPPIFVPPCRIPPYAIGVIILGRLQ